MEHSEFLDAILAGDRKRAVGEAARQLELGLAHLYEAVVTPALREIGERWVSNQLSVADEHVATALAQSAIAAIYPRVRWPPRGPPALVGCVEGERHEIGARMVADLLALDGWSEVFLGSDTPLESLADKVRELRPRLVALSVTLPKNREQARRTAAVLREASPGTRLILGGAGVSREAAAELGFDAFAPSASQAVEVVRAWKPEDSRS
ncbi:MAG: cobalamin-dependent protein [Deltaproteobacteria bacterium]|nr:cobalamin-dependent protein [Deltaproteobacteria bacterium]